MQALLWQKSTGNNVQCLLCQHRCIIPVGKKGLCGVRHNEKGRLCTLVYGKVAAVNLDPVEKKPLYHFKPGTKTYSFGTAGCNFACSFCQNHTISRTPFDKGMVPGRNTSADILVKEAVKHKAQSISFTYTEPTVFIELIQNVARRARMENLDLILVSNGYQSPECLATIYSDIKAANIDIKSMRDKFYTTYCKAKLKPVLDNVKSMVKMGWWVEVTTLLIPGLNDSEEELEDLAYFIQEELGPHVPWHISRFHAAYKMDRPATSLESMEKARGIGLEAGLHYVYLGNVQSMGSATTLCPDCKTACISREGFLSQNYIKNGCCPKCKRQLEGIW